MVSVENDPNPKDAAGASTSPGERLVAFLRRHEIDAEVIAPGVPMPTVDLAAAAIGAEASQILKSLLFVDRAGAAVLVIASGPNRVNRERLAAVAGLDRPRMADPETVLRVTGYPAGGVAPIGHREPVRVLIVRRAADLDVAFGGGGAEELPLRIRPADIIRLTGAEVVDVVDGERA